MSLGKEPRGSSSWSPGPIRAAWWGALALFAPKRALLSRHFARYDEDPVYQAQWRQLLHERGYRDARSNDQQTPFSSTWPRSADADMLQDLPRLRARCRELGRDDPVGSGVIRAWTEGVVGTGLEDRATSTLGPGREDSIDAAWRAQRDRLFPAEGSSWKKAQRTIAQSAIVDGEVLVTRYWPLGGGPVRFELVEADRLQTPYDARPADPEGLIRDGVERDRDGRIVAYWIARHHPYDTAVGAVQKGNLLHSIPRTTEEYRRVEARDAFHWRLGNTRPGQTRGEPVLHAVIQDLRDLDLLVEAVLKRVQVSASFAAFIESREDLEDVFEATGRKHGMKIEQDIVPGMIFKLYPGEKVSFANPNFPLPDLDVFVRLLARRIGTSLGVSWQIVLSDFSEANYSSAKADERRADQSYSTARSDLVELLSWVRQSVLEDALMRGDLDLEDATSADVSKAVWISPMSSVLLDPEKENRADVIAHEGGLETMRDIQARRGKDWEEVMRQRLLEEKREAELREELELPPVTSEDRSERASIRLRGAWRDEHASKAEAA